MYVVIFRATLAETDAAYSETAQRLRQKAFDQYGCVDFVSMSENGQEIALSYWRNLDDIRRWRQDSEHVQAQQLGKLKWYADFSVEIATLETVHEDRGSQ